MQKIKLLIADSHLVQPWFMPLWQEFFDCEIFDWAKNYNSADGVVLIDDRYKKAKYNQIKARGLQIVRPYLMDSNIHDPSEILAQDLILRAPESIWIQESVQWRYWNYHAPRAPSVPSKFFLLLMNLQRPSRDRLRSAVAPCLDSSLHSYVAKGIYLPGDDIVASEFHYGTANDRLYVPDWYAQTCFSIVSETKISNDLFIGEKIFKPLAYNHPAVVYGTPGSMAYIRGLGFETFGHVIDESYDSDTDADSRLHKITAVVNDLYQEFTRTGTVFQDSTTQQILAHNHALFFDQARVRNMFETQIARPIMEFAESR
jgi:hypothetical protein